MITGNFSLEFDYSSSIGTHTMKQTAQYTHQKVKQHFSRLTNEQQAFVGMVTTS